MPGRDIFVCINRAVTSNMIIAHCPWILQRKTPFNTSNRSLHNWRIP